MADVDGAHDVEADETYTEAGATVACFVRDVGATLRWSRIRKKTLRWNVEPGSTVHTDKKPWKAGYAMRRSITVPYVPDGSKPCQWFVELFARDTTFPGSTCYAKEFEYRYNRRKRPAASV